MKTNSNTTRPADRLPTLLLQLYGYTSRQRRLQFLLLLILTLLSSLAEILSLGAVMPFIGILTQPDIVFDNPWSHYVVQLIGLSRTDALVLPLTLVFAGAVLLAAGLRLLLLWFSIRLANDTGADLSIEAWRRTLHQPYPVHIARNSSEVVSGIVQKVVAATTVLTSLVRIATTGILCIAILGTLMAIEPLLTGITVVITASGYALLGRVMRPRLMRNSEYVAEQQTRVIQHLQEGLGGIRDVLLDGSQSLHTGTYARAIRRMHDAGGANQYMTQAPRFVMEALGMTLIALLAYAFSRQPGGLTPALPALAALALGIQRLLPLLQQLYSSWAMAAARKAALADVLALLQQPLPGSTATTGGAVPEAPLVLRDRVQFTQVSFRYAADQRWILKDASLTLVKGQCLGLIGATGSGKSTVIDLLTGLLTPTSGTISIDGQRLDPSRLRAWQRAIAYVPQQLFLADTTIARNIAFGTAAGAIDIDRVRQSARQARIAAFIEDTPDGYQTRVGEHGIRLSGGQRQRIGIARALYKRASILILDEPGSALDDATATAVMETIRQLSGELTILIVTHNEALLPCCDTVLTLAGSTFTTDARATADSPATPASAPNVHPLPDSPARHLR